MIEAKILELLTALDKKMDTVIARQFDINRGKDVPSIPIPNGQPTDPQGFPIPTASPIEGSVPNTQAPVPDNWQIGMLFEVAGKQYPIDTMNREQGVIATNNYQAEDLTQPPTWKPFLWNQVRLLG